MKLLAIFFFFFGIANAQKIEIKLDKNCSEEKVVPLFRASKKIDFVKSDFEMFGSKEIDIIVSEGAHLSNDEIKQLAKRANCEVTFIERESN